MCRACYEHFLKVSGGQRAGANPPAFTRGIQRELAAAERDVRARGPLCSTASLPGARAAPLTVGPPNRRRRRAGC